LSGLPREINYVTTNSFPQHASKGTLASRFSAHSLTGETRLFWGGRGEGSGKEKQEKTGHLSPWQEWSKGGVEVTNCPRLRGFPGHPVGQRNNTTKPSSHTRHGANPLSCNLTITRPAGKSYY